MAQVASGDRRTITAGNLAHLSALTKLDCATAGWLDLKSALPVTEVPVKESWRPGLLDCLLAERTEHEREGRDTKRTVAMISSLCCT